MSFKVAFSSIVLWFFGWKALPDPPPMKKCVVIAVPHTSNWDYVFMIMCSWRIGVRLHWVGKVSLFKSPLGPLYRWTGGVPVDRSASQNFVDSMVQTFSKNDALALVVAPSGTRSRQDHWKSGFYHIARGAGVPIVMGFLDYSKKVGGFGPAIVPSSDVRADMDKIRAFYKDIRGKFPAQETTIALKLEAEAESVAATGSGDTSTSEASSH